MKLKKFLGTSLLVSILIIGTSSMTFASNISTLQNFGKTQPIKISAQTKLTSSLPQKSLTLGKFNFHSPKLFTDKNKSSTTPKAVGNNSPDTACYVDSSLFGQTLGDYISGDDVENWYYFSAKDNSLINFMLKQASDQQNIAVLYQLQSDLSTLVPVASDTDSGTLNINYSANGASGYYFLRIIPTSPATGSNYQFILNDVSYVVNSSSTVKASGVLSALTPTIYNFTALLPESYNIMLDCPIGENITVTLLNSNNNSITAVNYPAGQNSYLTTQTLDPGNYNVILQSTDQNVVSDPFTFQVFPIRTGSEFSDVNIGLGKVNWNEGYHYYIHDTNTNFNISGKLLDSSGNPVSNANIAVAVYDPAWDGYNQDLTTVSKTSSTDINGNFNFTAASPVARGVETSVNGHIYDYAQIYLLWYQDSSTGYVILPATNIGSPEPLYIYGY
ncbi:MAG: carboxypeptidase-like regulatory domain-containing protein [Clostridium sp.]|jgi:hypothetical protein|uniref:carboxypeptidase-like regulatory domain-containing protein n=1 Tax=Clostridium sp. TaxID=1506 RepID=UPI0025B8B02B|nr:carboxypeptidase-like regulatory domain-containing protein [Clostridium sp.]MCH3964286.1 carboxypeptidase-like regulatory domain-containing protein [Clostridium sp.]MCI1715464.1 carboxypeptidase-like regulatory domain-containing protein [Clostridium sp.]MCI1799745.1 carboxypeptidase-like regulatory domain-containing protein [Clostridium sp.]MCI1813647.1 carboxypeptidase-like regulatory domain-containing protein [Clostridium sp.]MCI1870561.1 carboxypeptidase-like regulatory domain-containing